MISEEAIIKRKYWIAEIRKISGNFIDYDFKIGKRT